GDRRVGIAGRYRAAADVAAKRDPGRADRDLAADPGVLLVRLQTFDLDQHPEAPHVHRALVGDLGQVVDRRARDQRDAAVTAPVDADLGLDDPQRGADVVRERSGPWA